MAALGAIIMSTPALMVTFAVAVIVPGPHAPSMVCGEMMVLPSRSIVLVADCWDKRGRCENR
jgi:hypothetical protein